MITKIFCKITFISKSKIYKIVMCKLVISKKMNQVHPNVLVEIVDHLPKYLQAMAYRSDLILYRAVNTLYLYRIQKQTPFVIFKQLELYKKITDACKCHQSNDIYIVCCGCKIIMCMLCMKICEPCTKKMCEKCLLKCKTCVNCKQLTCDTCIQERDCCGRMLCNDCMSAVDHATCRKCRCGC